MANEGLTPKQENFCNYYVETGNASEAYRKAYDANRMKPETVNRSAFDLLNNPKIATRVEELKDELKKRSDFNKDEAVNILSAIARANIVDCLTISSNELFTTILIKDVDQLPDNLKLAIQSIKSTDKGFEIKMYSKIDAISKISKMFGWDAPVKTQLSGANGEPLKIEATISEHKISFEDYEEN